MGLSATELLIHRLGTKQFIEKDFTTIVLIPSVKTTEYGTDTFTDGTPRLPQNFKMIYPGGDGIIPTGEGTTRRFDFILVGEYNAEVEIGDHWKEGEQFYQVEWVDPYNEYEVKVGGSSHGPDPDHG